MPPLVVLPKLMPSVAHKHANRERAHLPPLPRRWFRRRLAADDDLDAVGRAHAAEEGHRRAVEIVGGRDAVQRVERLVRLDLLCLDVPRFADVLGEVEVGGADRRDGRALVRLRRDERRFLRTFGAAAVKRFLRASGAAKGFKSI